MKLPKLQSNRNDVQRNKLALNFYNHKFLVALQDFRSRWDIKIIDPMAEDGWKDTLFFLDEYREELAYLITLLPSPSYFEDWLIVHFVVFHDIIGIAVPHLENWAERYRGDYSIKLNTEGVAPDLTITIYSQLADADWDELKRAANKILQKLPPKTTHKGDDLTMLAMLANLYRDTDKQKTYGMISTQLADLGYTRKDGGLFTDDAIEKKLKKVSELGF